MATVRKLIVEVVDARNLLPKDGHGTSSPYVVIDFYGQRKRTKTVIKDLNPTWNEPLDFNMGGPSNVFGDTLEIDVYHDKNYGPTRRHNHLGRVRFSSSSTQFVRKGEEALMYFPLEKKYLLSWIQGEIGLKIYYSDEAASPPTPTPPPAPENPSPVEEKKEEESGADTAAPPAPPGPESGGDVSAKLPDEGPPSPPEEEQVKNEDELLPPLPPEEEEQIKNDGKKNEDELLPPLEASSSPVRDPPPEIEVMASAVSGTIPEVKVADDTGIRPPPSMPPTPAISRSVSTASFESIPIERSTFDLVEKMHYLFVRVVKARSLPTNGCPVVKIVVSSNRVVSKPARKTNFFEWDQTFAFGRESPESSVILEVSVWDPPNPGAADPTEGLSMREFLGGICFDTTEIPLRDPPDSPLAPQWYRLEGGGAHMGDLMLATWVGTQADESFPEAWKTDTAGNVNSRAKVYLSPKLWYLRATILEAQDVLFAPKESMFQVKAQLGNQVLKTKPAAVSRNGSPAWNEDLMFVAAEPFGDQLVLTLEHRGPKGSIVVGVVRVALTTIERRVDDRNVVGKWYTFDDPNTDEKKVYKARVQLRLCFDGGYHVMEEAAHMCSDYRPTARQLWKPSVGMVELGIIGCTNLLPAKAVNGKGSIDAYAIAKYGPKWVRTRTVSDSLDPKWNEQYTWKVYDPCTVLTIGVFDSSGGFESEEHLNVMRPDSRVGKVRIRISTLHTGKVYRNSYPLLTLTPMGLKKMGDIELAVRFVRSTPNLDVLQVYSQPLLPLMHHTKPLAPGQQEMLRVAAVKILAVHLSRSEPPLRQEVVRYMLDADSHTFSMRKVRANWFRIINLVAGVIDVVKWIEDTRTWKNPTSTILVHALLVMLVWFPDLIIPTLAFYVFVIGAWNYRFRSRDPLPHFDPKISLAENIDRDELDEEFDIMPSNRPSEVVRARYDKLRTLGARVQTVLGDLATQGERVQALVTWRDPRATGIFVGLCFVVAIILYLVPSKMVAMASGFYYLRHPMFRDRAPSPAINFIRRLPSKTDRLL